MNFPDIILLYSGPIGAGKTYTAFLQRTILSRFPYQFVTFHFPLASSLKALAYLLFRMKKTLQPEEDITLQVWLNELRLAGILTYDEIKKFEEQPQDIEERLQEGFSLTLKMFERSVRILSEVPGFSEDVIHRTPETVDVPPGLVSELKDCVDTYYEMLMGLGLVGKTNMHVLTTAVRRFLQLFGTNFGRDLVDSRIWTYITLATIHSQHKRSPVHPVVFFVDDLRFPNEKSLFASYAASREMFMKHIFILKDGINLEEYVEKADHESEKHLLTLFRDADVTIVNPHTPDYSREILDFTQTLMGMYLEGRITYQRRFQMSTGNMREEEEEIDEAKETE